MSNEMKDWLKDNQEENKKLIEKFPYLAIEKGYYKSTRLDCVLKGWKEITIQMCEDLNEVLGNFKEEFYIMEMKEKWGMLQVYHGALPEEIYDEIEQIINEYQDISFHTCYICGKSTNRRTSGRILPICNEHMKGE